MNKLAIIFSTLSDIQQKHEPFITPYKAKAITAYVAKKLNAPRPRIIFGGEDFYDENTNILSISGSKPAFYHELGHYVMQHSTKPRKAIETLANIGEKLTLPAAAAAPALYAISRRRLPRGRAAVLSLLPAAFSTGTQLLDELLATHKGVEYAPRKIKRKMEAMGILPSLTYTEPFLYSAAGVGGVELLERLWRRRL